MSSGRQVTPPAEADLERLRRLLGGAELRWLVARVRARLERGLPLDGTVTLDAEVSPASAKALATA